MLYLFIPLGIYICTYSSQWLKRREKRKYWYDIALKKSQQLNRKLVVIGDPDGGVTHNDYGYGDMCIDLTGCPKAPLGLALDLSKDNIPLPDNSVVVYCSYVLELVDDPHKAFNEMLRVAGSLDNIYILCLNTDESAFYTYPGIKNNIKGPPFYDKFIVEPAYFRNFSYDR